MRLPRSVLQALAKTPACPKCEKRTDYQGVNDEGTVGWCKGCTLMVQGYRSR
jgi:hypothetical protein